MEEIEILEDFIKYYEAEAISRKRGRFLSINVDECDIQAIENLIKGYRELEIKSSALENQNKYWKSVANDSIPKSKIKEKIEELKGYRDLAKEQIEEKVIIADSDSLNYGRAEAHNKDIEVLQELMEDK